MATERTGAALVLAALAVLACGRKEQPAGAGQSATAESPAAGTPQVELGTSAQLDSGNVAFRAKDYRGALGHYRLATERAPDLAAGWFGLYMAQNALGDKAGADSAMRKVQALAPGMVGAHPMPGSTPAPGSGDAGLPAGHPGTGAPQLPPGHPTTTGAR